MEHEKVGGGTVSREYVVRDSDGKKFYSESGVMEVVVMR